MKNLKDLSEYVKSHKYYNSVLGASIQGYTMPVTDYGYASSSKTFWLFCDTEGLGLPINTFLKAAYKYPTVNLTVACEELSVIQDVKGFHLEYGAESFGEKDTVVLN